MMRLLDLAERPSYPSSPRRLHRAGLEVGDDDVGLLDKAKEDVASGACSKVNGHASLASVDATKNGGAAILAVHREPPALVPEAG